MHRTLTTALASLAAIGAPGGVALAAAQRSASGALNEADLERYQGRLVFNVDVGSSDVKVDASNGNVLSAVSDDVGGGD